MVASSNKRSGRVGQMAEGKRECTTVLYVYSGQWGMAEGRGKKEAREMKIEGWIERQGGEGKRKSIKSSNMNCALKWLLKSHQESKWEVKCSGEPGCWLLCVLQQRWLNYGANLCSTLTAEQSAWLSYSTHIFIPVLFRIVFLFCVWSI